MADQQVQQQRSQLRERFFMLFSNQVPEGFNRVQVEKDIRELAASLVLKGAIKNDDEWKRILLIKDRNQQLLEIFEKIMQAADDTQDEAPAARMDELMPAFNEHKKQLAQEAEAKKAEHPNPAQQTAKIIENLAKANARLRDTSPAAAEKLEELQEVVSIAIVTNPETAIPAAIIFATALAQDNPRFTSVDATDSLGPLVEPAQLYSQEIDNLTTQIANELPEIPARNDIAQVLTAFKLSNPQATTEDYKPLIEKIELRLAVEKQAVEIPLTAIEEAVAAKIEVTPQELIQQTIQSKLQQAGVPKQESVQTAQIITKFAPAIHYISSYAPSKTADEYKKNKEIVTKKLTDHVVERFLSSPRSPRNWIRNISEVTGRLNFYEIYTRAYGPAQFYQYQPELYTYPSRPEISEHDPFVSFVVSYGRSFTQDAIVGATLDAVVAGPIGAWILPDSAITAAFMFDDMLPAVLSTTAKAAAGVAVKTAAVTTTAEVAAASAGATTGASTGGLLGFLGGPVGIALGALIGAITGFVVKNKDKIWNFFKNLGVPILIGAAAFIGFVFTGATMLVGLIGAGAVTVASSFLIPQVGAITNLGPSAWLQPLGNFAGNLFSSLTELAVVEIATPIIVIIISIPIVVALLLFIINSGAYVVPPSGSIGLSQAPTQSPFITVVKEADTTTIANSQLPKTVTYKITVSAPKGTLTNISFSNNCSVLKEGSSPPCTHPLPSTTPANIDTATPFTFEYSQTYDTSFTDSLVSDSFTVTADSPEGKATSVGSASVAIGTPPTRCFDVAGSNWPANYKANVLSAVGTLTSFTAYAAKVCNGGTLKIVYDTTKNPGGWGYYSGSTIYLNGGGLSTQINALYIVAHESGHHLAGAAMPALYKQYLDTPGISTEIPLCSYVNTTEFSEAFAEAIALYVTHDLSSQWITRCSGSFQSKYPNHWNFEDSVIFK